MLADAIGPGGAGRRAAVALALAVAVTATAGQPVAAQAGSGINPGLGAPPAGVERSSAAACWRSFWDLSAAGRFEAAAHLLDLAAIPDREQRAAGEESARELWAVLEQVGAGRDAVRDQEPDRDGGPGRDLLVALRFARREASGEIWLRRVRGDVSGEVAWLVARQTVAELRPWYRALVEGKAAGKAEVVDPGLGPVPATVQRSTPREAVTGFVGAARRGEFALAAHYLDLGAIAPPEQRAEGTRLARRLFLVLQRVLWINPAKVSNDPAGASEAGIPEDQQRLSSIRARGEDVDILLERRVEPGGGQVWVFSSDTVAQIDRLYEAHGYGWIGDELPAVFFAVSFLGLQLWQWLGLILMLGLGGLVSRVAGHLVARASGGVVRRTAVTWDDELIRALDGPLGLILWALVLAACSPLLGLPPAAEAVARRLWRLLAIAGCGWLLFRAVDGAGRTMRAAAAERNALALTFIPILQRVGKLVVGVLLFLAALDIVGVNVVAALAGVGLGGLAVAFAAQKTLENMFGALAIAGDRPFKVGDYVTIGDVSGTVEDVGLRSTKVRTLERTLVTIPNSTVVNGTVTNLAARDRIAYSFTIGLVYGSSAAQVTFVLDETRRLLLKDPRVVLDGQRTRFRGFGPSSLDIEVFAWIATTDYAAYTAIAEELNLGIMAIVERSGSSFAFPAGTLYLGRSGAPEARRAAQVAEEIERRRAAGELVVPEPSPEQIERARAERRRRLESETG